MTQTRANMEPSHSPAQKLAQAARLQLSARRLKRAAIRALHPDWPEALVEQKLREAFLHARG